MMTIKCILTDYPLHKARINLLKIKLIEVRTSYTGMKSPNMDSLGGGSVGSSVENEVLRKTQKENEILAEIEKLEREVEKVEICLSVLSDVERKIIEYRYFENMTWVQIGSELRYHFQSVRLHHSKALEKLSKVYK